MKKAEIQKFIDRICPNVGLFFYSHSPKKKYKTPPVPVLGAAGSCPMSVFVDAPTFYFPPSITPTLEDHAHVLREYLRLKKEDFKLPLICINAHYLRTKRYGRNNRWIKSSLLHEIGHISKNHITKNYSREMSKCELDAHIWGINKACELKMYAIARSLISQLEEEWSRPPDKMNLSRYHRAYKLFKKCPKYQSQLNKLKKSCNYQK